MSPHIGAGVIAGPSILGLRTDDRTRPSPDTPPSLLAVMYGVSAVTRFARQIAQSAAVNDVGGGRCGFGIGSQLSA